MMIIGFGRVEVEREKSIMRECADALAAGDTRAARVVQGRLEEEANRYKALPASDAPERYSTFWFSHHEIWEGRSITEFNFTHINRRHAFSPDGWAALSTKAVLVSDKMDGHRFFLER